MPQEPPEPSFEMTIHDFRDKEIDLVIHQIIETFMSENDFVKSRAFLQFLWRSNLQIFQAKCKKIKVEQPLVEDSFIEEEVKADIKAIPIVDSDQVVVWAPIFPSRTCTRNVCNRILIWSLYMYF